MSRHNQDVETTNRELEEVEIGDKEEDLMEATNEEEEENAEDEDSSSSSDEEEDDDMSRDKEAEEDGAEATTQTAAAQNEEEEDDPEANWEAKLPEPEADGPAAEKRLIKELDWERKKTGKNQTWYLLSAKWLEDWKTYVDYDDDDADSDPDEDDQVVEKVRPGPITNSMLLEPQSDYLRRECTEGRHYIIVPEEAWRLWWKWYAGGPPLPRKTVTTGWYNQQYVVEVRLLHLKFVKSSDKNVELPSSFSKTATIGDLKKRMCKRLKVDPANVRLWDWHARNKIKLLTDMTDTLDEAQIIDNQLVLFEEKDPATGKFPEDTYGSSYRASGYGSSSTYGSSSSANGSYGSSYGYSRYSEPGEPGVCGLQNLGNTCFMNSALQCLSNTVPLTNFFLRGTYKGDVNEVNPLGTKGELVEAYTALLREIWSGSARSTAPRSFKYKLERFAPQFSGYQQHDSQELLGFLLDGIHEDLNRIKQKPYVESKEADGRPDTEVAEETWQGHRARNDSVIVDRFQGQLKSTLICPECSKVSITFDPFMYLSLPLPMKMTRRLAVTFISRDPARRPIKYALDVPKHGSIKELRMAVAVFVGVDARNLILADLYNSRFFKEYSDRESLDVIQDRDVTVVYELPPNPSAEEKAKVEPEPEPEPVEDPSDDDDQVWGDGYSYRSMGVHSRATVRPKVEEPKDGIIQVRVLNRKDETVTHRTYYGTPTSYTRKTLFGVPFILQIPNKITYADLYRQALHQLQRFLTGMPDQVPVEEPMEAEQETQEQATAEEQQPRPEEQAAEPTGIEEADEPVHSGEPGASAEKKNKGESYGSDNEHDDDSFSSSSSSSDDEPSYSTSSSSIRQPVETKAPVIPESIDGRPLLFTLKLVDHFGVNDQVEFSGGKHGEEVITLKNTQTVALCWRNESLSFYDDEKEIDMEVHPSARPVERDEGDQSVSLYDCLELFTQAEQLGPEDPWYCNKCAEFRQATKKFDVWKVPRILVVHLKRFSYRNKYWREKLDTFVDFPLDDLDLSPHVLGPVSTPPVYELYAVSNHYGSLGGGHYTAYAKNHRENKWYKFDDSSVSSVQAESVKTSAAYVLFYRLKEDASEWRGLSVAEAESGETAAPSAASATTPADDGAASDDDSSSSSSDAEDAEPEHSDADGEAGDVDMQDPEADQ